MSLRKEDIEFRLRGYDELQAKLNSLAAVLRDNRAAASSVADFMLRVARRNAPVMSGRLRRSIKPKVGRNISRLTVGGKAMPYGAVQERGWKAHHIRGRFFMLRARTAAKATAPRLYARAIEEQIRRRHLS